MVEHMICIKLKPDTTPEQEESLIQQLRGLKNEIPEIVDLTAGKNFTPERGQGFTVGLVVRFKDKAGLAVYDTHPKHVVVKNFIKSVAESILAVDFEF